MRIGEVAKLTGCPIQTIRYYEKERLLASTRRSGGNYRLYDPSTVDRLMFIKHCRSLDLSLAEIRRLLELNRFPGTRCNDVNQMIDVHIHQVEARLRELARLREDLILLRNSCGSDRTVEQCGIMHNLSGSQS